MRQAACVTGDVGIDIAVRTFEIGVGDHAGTAVARPADIDHVEVERADSG